ncbi:hypothetical protein NEOLEDRAFT_985411 [Neolentinus lepideus HHB14362 ss-1]|uniref:Uncharacterized protein n=1 Tax=Neolentinus lepideus HHB14362 ss-1 TaxID=1314782 RepID=A0A165N6B4_9AGAM|nr:hypothetical protein NEOLEDRAFT_985411 [Neolentinus lepideus HHB14362 ss-1]
MRCILVLKERRYSANTIQKIPTQKKHLHPHGPAIHPGTPSSPPASGVMHHTGAHNVPNSIASPVMQTAAEALRSKSMRQPSIPSDPEEASPPSWTSNPPRHALQSSCLRRHAPRRSSRCPQLHRKPGYADSSRSAQIREYAIIHPSRGPISRDPKAPPDDSHTAKNSDTKRKHVLETAETKLVPQRKRMKGNYHRERKENIAYRTRHLRPAPQFIITDLLLNVL